MGTSSAIGVKLSEGGVQAVTCHWDGYPSHVGRILHDYYGDEARARDLLALGSLSSLGERIIPSVGVRHSFEHPAWGVTVAYHRDRGEDMVPPVRFADVEDYRLNAKTRLFTDYVYLLDDREWSVLKDQKWVSVASVLRKEGISIENDPQERNHQRDGIQLPPLFKGIPETYMGDLKTRESNSVNICAVKMLAVCKNGMQSTVLASRLSKLAMDARIRDEGIDVGRDLYLFDGKVTQITLGVGLECWVKWGITDEQAIALVRFLEDNGPLRLAIVEWCIPEIEAYGVITWADGQLTTLELPQLHWKEKGQFGKDKLMLGLALAAHGQEREITMDADK